MVTTYQQDESFYKGVKTTLLLLVVGTVILVFGMGLGASIEIHSAAEKEKLRTQLIEELKISK